MELFDSEEPNSKNKKTRKQSTLPGIAMLESVATWKYPKSIFVLRFFWRGLFQAPLFDFATRK
jgi:hypothetical protein